MNCTVDCWNTVGVRGSATCERLDAVAHCRNCPAYVTAGRMLLDREVPDGAREEWARLTAEPRPSRPPHQVSVVVFRIGVEWLALKTELFEQAVTARPVHSVPFRTNRVFRGLVNIDGELLLCFSAGEALGLEPSPVAAPDMPAREQLLVVSHDGHRFAFQVDEVLGVRALAPGDFTSAPAVLSRAPDTVITSAFSAGERRVGLLDEARLFEHVTRTLTL